MKEKRRRSRLLLSSVKPQEVRIQTQGFQRTHNKKHTQKHIHVHTRAGDPLTHWLMPPGGGRWAKPKARSLAKLSELSGGHVTTSSSVEFAPEIILPSAIKIKKGGGGRGLERSPPGPGHYLSLPQRQWGSAHFLQVLTQTHCLSLFRVCSNNNRSAQTNKDNTHTHTDTHIHTLRSGCWS